MKLFTELVNSSPLADEYHTSLVN